MGLTVRIIFIINRSKIDFVRLRKLESKTLLAGGGNNAHSLLFKSHTVVIADFQVEVIDRYH